MAIEIMVSIDEILTGWQSIDMACYACNSHVFNCPTRETGQCLTECLCEYEIDDIWEVILSEKRRDENFDDITESVELNGILFPFSVDLSNKRFGDGHHRLAACIDLGITEVPVFDGGIRVDPARFGAWQQGDPVYNAVIKSYEYLLETMS